ncbi:hypothetical protein ACLOJK_019156 [Asimina triloba]
MELPSTHRRRVENPQIHADYLLHLARQISDLQTASSGPSLIQIASTVRPPFGRSTNPSMTATMESISMDEASMKWATPLELADINVSIIAINRKPSTCKRAPNDCCPFGQQAASISTASKKSPELKFWGRNRHPPYFGQPARSSRASVRIPSSSSMPKWSPSQAADAPPSPSCTNPPGSIHPNRPIETFIFAADRKNNLSDPWQIYIGKHRAAEPTDDIAHQIPVPPYDRPSSIPKGNLRSLHHQRGQNSSPNHVD